MFDSGEEATRRRAVKPQPHARRRYATPRHAYGTVRHRRRTCRPTGRTSR
ncbi:predicted protein [Plenodomus lingam JN3]|uniref:Predicted protein n=1 Tax=Leptosphaeria maculans (strain JN3 / isolate v23.1.3 / race Av1-4-5-6-7-8) TaxID=985895 RepID=E4ZJF2_LEPMJ|nr:predicted protein [Plenodomus lingam JN3]CBX91583.1 predicted protein [Plenodomus lingam JN3]